MCREKVNETDSLNLFYGDDMFIEAVLHAEEKSLTPGLMCISYRLPALTREWRRVKMRVSFLSLTELSNFFFSSVCWPDVHRAT